MKRTARNIIAQIPEKNGQLVLDQLPAPLLEPFEELEKAYNALIDRCEKRKQNFNFSMSRVIAENNQEMLNAMKMGNPFIRVSEMLALFIAIFKEMDIEMRSMVGRIDQLEAENKKLKEKIHVTV